MTWARVSNVGVAVAVVMIIIANAPAVLTDTLQTAVAQMRVNAAITQPAVVTLQSEISSNESVPATSVKKSVK